MKKKLNFCGENFLATPCGETKHGEKACFVSKKKFMALIDAKEKNEGVIIDFEMAGFLATDGETGFRVFHQSRAKELGYI